MALTYSRPLESGKHVALPMAFSQRFGNYFRLIRICKRRDIREGKKSNKSAVAVLDEQTADAFRAHEFDRLFDVLIIVNKHWIAAHYRRNFRPRSAQPTTDESHCDISVRNNTDYMRASHDRQESDLRIVHQARCLICQRVCGNGLDILGHHFVNLHWAEPLIQIMWPLRLALKPGIWCHGKR